MVLVVLVNRLSEEIILLLRYWLLGSIFDYELLSSFGQMDDFCINLVIIKMFKVSFYPQIQSRI